MYYEKPIVLYGHKRYYITPRLSLASLSSLVERLQIRLALIWGRLLASPANFTLYCKGLPGPNTVTYYENP